MLSSKFMIVEEWLFKNYMITWMLGNAIGKNVSDSELINLSRS